MKQIFFQIENVKFVCNDEWSLWRFLMEWTSKQLESFLYFWYTSKILFQSFSSFVDVWHFFPFWDMFARLNTFIKKEIQKILFADKVVFIFHLKILNLSRSLNLNDWQTGYSNVFCFPTFYLDYFIPFQIYISNYHEKT